jgi:hypothetical protein
LIAWMLVVRVDDLVGYARLRRAMAPPPSAVFDP